VLQRLAPLSQFAAPLPSIARLDKLMASIGFVRRTSHRARQDTLAAGDYFVFVRADTASADPSSWEMTAGRGRTRLRSRCVASFTANIVVQSNSSSWVWMWAWVV